MDYDEDTELIEMDPEEDTDKKARRSSILKPQKPRNPLSTLDFSEANADNTLSKATRRVSFASSNFVKPFAADPEKNTIWDTTYEEEVNHTDSTKNSTDQAQGTRTDFLNMTSIHSATTDLLQSEINPFAALSEGVGISIIKDQTVSDVIPGESLVSFARKLRSKSIEQYDVQTMDFTLLNKTAEVKIKNLSCTTTKLAENTMEITCLTDKENVNPIINDLSLIIPKRNCLETANTTKYFTEEDMDCTKPVKSNEEVIINKSINKNDIMINTKKRESVMELTCLSSEKNEDLYLEKPNERQDNPEEDNKSKMIYHDDSVNAMELSSVNKDNKMEFSPNKSRRRTILFNEAEEEGNMDFTFVDTNDDVNVKENSPMRAEPTNETRAKNKTIIFNHSGNDMEFTTSFPLKIQKDIKTKEETLRFDNSGEEMEFTNTFAIQKNSIKESKSKTICFDKSECNMEFTTTLVGAIDTPGNSMIAQVDDMEITTALSTEAIEKKSPDKSELACEMELTSTLQADSNNSKQCDMSLTKNLCIPARFDDDKKVHLDYTDTSDTHTVKDSVEPNLTCNNKSKTKENLSSISLLSVKDISVLPNSSNVSKSKNVLQISSNNTAADHQGSGNDISTCNVSKTHDIKRHILDSADADASKKRRIQELLSFNDKSGVDNNVPLASNKLDQNTSLALEPDPTKDLQTSDLSSSNVLYTEPMKHQLKKAPVADLSANLHLDGSLNLHQISTPAMSFHMNLSSMSPCIEDTQQLIHATFSKPETLKILNKATERSFEKPEDHHDSMNNSQDFIKRSNETLKDNRSCFLEDITPLALVAEDFDNSMNGSDKMAEREDLQANTSSPNSSNVGDYTFRSQAVLANITKHLLVYEPLTPKRNVNLAQLSKQFHENCRLISEFLKSTVPPVDLETRHKQDMEISQSSVSDTVLSTSEDSGLPPALQLIVPKSIQERINEIAKHSKRYWKVKKFDGDYCYFYTLFETMSLKVDIHPELGVVYSVETQSNLSDLAQPLCHYQFKQLQQKLGWDNLSSVLGHNFDVFALLDYVYMSMEEIVNFHSEYLKLVEKYGKSHHFRMNPDFSVTFEILKIKEIIFWVITIKLPMTSQNVVMREDVTAVHKVGKIVNEEHIRTIAENSAKGLNFLRNFIDNVDEYVTRMGRRLK